MTEYGGDVLGGYDRVPKRESFGSKVYKIFFKERTGDARQYQHEQYLQQGGYPPEDYQSEQYRYPGEVKKPAAFCVRCGLKNETQGKFCVGCGYQLI